MKRSATRGPSATSAARSFPGGAAPVHTLEMNEGLAEYCGVKLRGTSDLESLGYLAEGPVLELPLSGAMTYGFDPNEVVGMKELGTVYPSLSLGDTWGHLDAPRGARIAQDHHRAFVAAPPDSEIVPEEEPAAGQDPATMPGIIFGPGWKIHVVPGWILAPGPREGDFVLRRGR